MMSRDKKAPAVHEPVEFEAIAIHYPNLMFGAVSRMSRDGMPRYGFLAEVSEETAKTLPLTVLRRTIGYRENVPTVGISNRDKIPMFCSVAEEAFPAHLAAMERQHINADSCFRGLPATVLAYAWEWKTPDGYGTAVSALAIDFREIPRVPTYEEVKIVEQKRFGIE